MITLYEPSVDNFVKYLYFQLPSPNRRFWRFWQFWYFLYTSIFFLYILITILFSLDVVFYVLLKSRYILYKPSLALIFWDLPISFHFKHLVSSRIHHITSFMSSWNYLCRMIKYALKAYCSTFFCNFNVSLFCVELYNSKGILKFYIFYCSAWNSNRWLCLSSTNF